MIDYWRPIDTAPKDGTEIVLFLDYGTFSFQDHASWWQDAPNVPGEFVGCRTHSAYGKAATHWMPLPRPPIMPTGEK